VLGLEVGTEDGGWVKPVGAASGVVLGLTVVGSAVEGETVVGPTVVGAVVGPVVGVAVVTGLEVMKADVGAW
jgi:hypothetical protein